MLSPIWVVQRYPEAPLGSAWMSCGPTSPLPPQLNHEVQLAPAATVPAPTDQYGPPRYQMSTSPWPAAPSLNTSVCCPQSVTVFWGVHTTFGWVAPVWILIEL